MKTARKPDNRKNRKRPEREEKRQLEAWLAKHETGYVAASWHRSWAFGRRKP